MFARRAPVPLTPEEVAANIESFRANNQLFHAALIEATKLADDSGLDASFAHSLLHQVEQRGSLTERQVEAGKRFIDRAVSIKTGSLPDQNSDWVGVVGKKLDKIGLELQGCLLKQRRDGGSFYLYTFHDPKGNVIKLFASERKGDIPEARGARFIAKCRVKAHDEFQGVKQTVITHLKRI